MIIDKEFQKIIPELTTEEFTQLKENILKEGCRDALIVWNDTLVDGHNRYSICIENNIPFTTKEIEFESREEAKEWIINNQLGRRNLAPYQRLELAEKLEESIRAKAKENQGKRNDLNISVISPKSQSIDTRKELAKIAGVGESSVKQFKVIQKEGTEEQKERARIGGKGNTLNAIYGEIEQEKKKNKTCIHCNKTMESVKFLPGKNVCRECDNRIRRKSAKNESQEEPPQEPQGNQYHEDPRYNHPLYDLSNMPQYSMKHLEVEINGTFESILSTLDGALEERKELFKVKENIQRFNEAIKNIIKELEERIIDESKEN